MIYGFTACAARLKRVFYFRRNQKTALTGGFGIIAYKADHLVWRAFFFAREEESLIIPRALSHSTVSATVLEKSVFL